MDWTTGMVDWIVLAFIFIICYVASSYPVVFPRIHNGT